VAELFKIFCSHTLAVPTVMASTGAAAGAKQTPSNKRKLAC
jgi:hypothetical protein